MILPQFLLWEDIHAFDVFKTPLTIAPDGRIIEMEKGKASNGQPQNNSLEVVATLEGGRLLHFYSEYYHKD